MNNRIVIIGAGAAGCFAAIEVKRRCPEAEVTVLEKGTKPLAKVAITGGGRCNLTNSFAEVKSLEQVYPRGFRLMKKLFHHFSPKDAYEWFEREGVRLVTQDDECVFPQSQDAMEIVLTLTSLMNRLGVNTLCGCKVSNIVKRDVCSDGNPLYSITYTKAGSTHVMEADKVIVTTGGHPSPSGFDMLKGLDLEIMPPVPSLFSLCISDKSLTALMGTVVEQAQVSLAGTKIKTNGALLITHWGISGPAVLKLSSHGARILAEKDYQADVTVNWLFEMSNNDVQEMLSAYVRKHAAKKITSAYPSALNARLWVHLVQRAKLSADMRWSELQGKAFNRLLTVLTSDTYHVMGKNRYKDEFVTCGGVSLNSLKHDTLEAKNHPGLHFAGEVTDVDAVTGGFNLQAAWTMGWVAAKAMASPPSSPVEREPIRVRRDYKKNKNEK